MGKPRFIFLSKVLLFLLILIIPIILAFLINSFNVKLDAFVAYIRGFGMYASFVILLLIIIGSSIGFVFQIPVAAAALILDYPEAILLSWIGLTFGAIISFYLARYLARDYFEKKVINKRDRFVKYDYWLEKHGFWAVLIFRFISLIPFEIINIGGGLSKIKFKDYLLGTLIGLIPGILITVYFVKSLHTFGTIHFLIAYLFITIFTLIPLLFKRVRDFIFQH